jgi:hypothetical protein
MPVRFSDLVIAGNVSHQWFREFRKNVPESAARSKYSTPEICKIPFRLIAFLKNIPGSTMPLAGIEGCAIWDFPADCTSSGAVLRICCLDPEAFDLVTEW